MPAMVTFALAFDLLAHRLPAIPNRIPVIHAPNRQMAYCIISSRSAIFCNRTSLTFSLIVPPVGQTGRGGGGLDAPVWQPNVAPCIAFTGVGNHAAAACLPEVGAS